MLTDDFLYEDRRPGRVLGEVDADNYPRFIMSTWQTGAGEPQFRVGGVSAVRGERFAVCRFDLVYGNGMTTENLHLIGLDATLTLQQAAIDFDAEDIDGAIAELDRLSQSEAS